MEKFQVDNKRECAATVSHSLKKVWPESGFATPGLCYSGENGNFKDHLPFCCPGCGKFGSIRCTSPKDKDGQKSWLIAEGTLSDPTTLTLSPSINCVGCCGWHGYLVAGQFQMSPNKAET